VLIKSLKMTMTDADVKKQINHMMAFIEQEANEKAEEIDAKAEEEFNIEKGRLVQQQRLKIMDFFERKEKQVELQKKIQSSNMLNQARLKALKARDDHVNSVLEEAKGKLVHIVSDKQKYTKILESLLTQGLCQLLEPQVFVRCRQVDLAIVESIIPPALAKYKSMVGKETAVKLDTENWLSKDKTGGLEILAMKGKIKVDNTLEARLDMIAEQTLPYIRGALFGSNPNRKHTD